MLTTLWRLSWPRMDDLVDIGKIKALQDFRANPEFEPVSIAFKRVDNILKDFHGWTFDVNCFMMRK